METSDIQKEYNDTMISGIQLPGKWTVKQIMENSFPFWNALVKNEAGEIHLVKFKKVQRLTIGSEVDVYASIHRKDFFIATSKD